MDASTASTTPTREELNAELVEVPEPPEQPAIPDPPRFEDSLAAALRHVRGRRGGDLVGVILVGSGARRAMTSHSDIDLIALVKGNSEGHEILRVGEHVVDIRYRSAQFVEEELADSLHLAPLLRKGRILFDHDGTGTKLIEMASQRFRKGPPPATMNEQIRLKAECFHWLGKAQDLMDRPATARYLLTVFFEECTMAFFRLRGFWLTAPAEAHRFMASREPALADLAANFLMATTLDEQLGIGRQLAELLFKDVPLPARID